MKRILVVEDDLALNAGLCFELDSAGYITITSYTCKKSLQLLCDNQIDLAILDINLPDGNGFDLCQKIKEQDPKISVIFLSVNDLEQDQITGFNLGADDYVTKPFSTSVLLKRIDVALRRSGNFSVSESDKNTFDFNDGFLQIAFDSLSVICNGNKLSITPNEYKILKLLIANTGNIITREIMIEKLWDNNGYFIDDHTLTVTINRLRNKLENKEHQYIKTIWGIGYTWNGGLL